VPQGPRSNAERENPDIQPIFDGFVVISGEYWANSNVTHYSLTVEL
jgi:hypothetical protein